MKKSILFLLLFVLFSCGISPSMVVQDSSQIAGGPDFPRITILETGCPFHFPRPTIIAEGYGGTVFLAPEEIKQTDILLVVTTEKGEMQNDRGVYGVFSYQTITDWTASSTYVFYPEDYYVIVEKKDVGNMAAWIVNQMIANDCTTISGNRFDDSLFALSKKYPFPKDMVISE